MGSVCTEDVSHLVQEDLPLKRVLNGKILSVSLVRSVYIDTLGSGRWSAVAFCCVLSKDHVLQLQFFSAAVKQTKPKVNAAPTVIVSPDTTASVDEGAAMMRSSTSANED